MPRNAPVEYDPTEDILYVRLKRAPVSWTKPVDDQRLVDYASDGSVIGVEFIAASSGVDLAGIPMRTELEALIAASDAPVRLVA